MNLSGVLPPVELPRVMVNQRAIGRLAAEHLLERGFHRLAYYGARGPWYSEQRRAGFSQRANAAGVPCEIFEIVCPANVRSPWHRQVATLDRWLKRLERPVGIMAMNDHVARVVVSECQRLGLVVPHEVAVIGSDNDTVVCEFCQPTISTVSRRHQRVGYKAAALLASLVAGKDPPPHDILVPPDGVVTRQSTDTLNVDEPQVVAAVRFMHDHLSERFGIGEVLRHVDISRRQLQLRFRLFLGCSPNDYLRGLRMEYARRLLERSEVVKLQKIAKACGVSSPNQLRRLFQRLTGMTPLEYHRQSQLNKLG